MNFDLKYVDLIENELYQPIFISFEHFHVNGAKYEG